MCGIAGILALDHGPVDVALLTRMTRAQAHRGPDDEGVWTSGAIGLGHRRLAIIDLSPGGHQPMHSPDGRFVITYNGEIYNYLELRQELRGLGHGFETQSDTEVILAAYAEWGEACVDRFLGMWAFAIWDERTRRLFCSRDPFGIKPFFYVHAVVDARFSFASDIRSLLLVGRSVAEPDWVFLAGQLTEQRFAREDETSFRHVRALPPATNLSIEDGRLRFHRYWDPSYADARSRYDYRDPVATFRELFVDAVRLHFRSDVPVGVCLSGGLDSSSIVGAASTFLQASLRTFSIEYPEPAWSEGEFIAEVNARYGCAARIATPGGDHDYLDTIRRMVWAHGEPDQGIGVYSQWKVMELAAGQVKVLLDGQGGDELLAGYPYFYESYIAQLARRGHWRRAWHEYHAYQPFAHAHFGRNILKRTAPPVEAAWRMLRPGRGAGNQRLKTALQGPLLAGFETAERVPRAAVDPALAGYDDLLTQHQYRTIRTDLLQSLLYFEDRNSMAFSIESRVPFLDRRLVEFCLALAPEARLGDGYTKRILRDSLADLLPERVRVRRDKKGFPTPLSRWLRGPLMDQVRALLLDGRVASRGIFNLPVIARHLDAHAAGQASLAVDIFNWVTLELWLQQFQDVEYRPAS